MLTMFSAIIALIVTFPLLGYLILFLISKRLTKNVRRAVSNALDGSVLILLFSVHFLILLIWQKSFFWIIILIMLVIALIFVLIHWKTKHEINFRPIFKGIWRTYFLLFTVAYVGLTLIGLWQRITYYLSFP